MIFGNFISLPTKHISIFFLCIKAIFYESKKGATIPRIYKKEGKRQGLNFTLRLRSIGTRRPRNSSFITIKKSIRNGPRVLVS
jgi:hypothetical protein